MTAKITTKIFFDELVKNKAKEAYETKDPAILSNFSIDPASIVRRAVARNRHTPKAILNILAFDPVYNVSFKAMQHRNCSIVRNVSELNHKCLSCERLEHIKDCSNCPD